MKKQATVWLFSPLTLGLTLVGVLVAAGLFFSSRPRVELPDMASGSPAIARNRTVEIGGIRRPASDVHRSPGRQQVGRSETVRFAYGKTPTLAPDTNETVRATFDALSDETRETPERKSPFAVGAKFDAESYRQDPQSYLSAFERGRVWQSAQPGPGVPLLGRISSRNQTLRQGESIRLQVKTEPNAPVSFTSFDLGAFQNQLPSITVAADADGVAEAVFTGTSGTIERVHILAASPVATGRLAFDVLVEPVN